MKNINLITDEIESTIRNNYNRKNKKQLDRDIRG